MTRGDEEVSLRVQFLEYWRDYGGFAQILRSPYIYASFAFFLLTSGTWLEPGWWDLVISILPSILGISLAAFTLFLSAGSESFREVIAGDDEGDNAISPFLKTATTFLHFLIVQFAALMFALIAKAFYSSKIRFDFFSEESWVAMIFWGCGFFLFMYSMSIVMAASFGIYEVVRWFDEYVSAKRNSND